MRFRTKKAQARRDRSKVRDSRFRSVRYESLEPRLCLHNDGNPADWLDHFNDDAQILQSLIAANPASVAQLSSAAPSISTASLSTSGQWGALQQWPVEFINALMLPTGKVLGWDRLLNLRLWDPVTNAITIPSSPGYNIFCTGTSLLADGTVLVTGGHVDNLVGLPFSSIYNPFTDTWTPLPNINAGRWYPSSTTLANGDVLILSGATNAPGVDDPLPQIYDITTGSWIDLTTALQSLPLYPRTFSAPNGEAFVAGPQQLSQYLDISGTGVWNPVANRIVPNRDYGSAVMYAPGKVLYVGGGSPATNTAEIIDLNQANPTWQAVAPMAFARRNCNATLLPNGEVLVTGGNTGSSTYDGTPVTAAEIWDPTTKTFTTLASESDIRWYHSTALLLPDGRVVSGSGDGHLTEQVYSPPYLFEGTQPTITSAPGTVRYGDSFFIGTPDAATITDVHWIRMGTSTHAQNWDQYIQEATFTQTTGGLMVSAPPTPNTAPPGYFMLFVDRGDVPSVAKIIRVGATLPALSVNDVSVTEGATGSTVNAVFTVSLELSSAQTVNVAYATANGSAVAGQNYVAQSGVLSFSPGVTSQTVTVAVKGDGIADPSETFSLNLSAPVGAILGKAQGQALIRDFNALPVLDIQGVQMQEGNSGTTNANFVVTLSSPRNQPVTVVYATLDGTAIANSDYIPQSGTLTFAAGVTQQTIAVPVIGDTIDEPHNWFFVNLSAPTGATLDIAQAKGLIYNDDNAVAISIPTFATVVEPTNGGTTNLVLTATLSGPSGKTITVGWQTLANGTAVDGKNFIGQYGGLTFNPGVTTQTFTVPIVGDMLKTPDETFSVELQANLVNGTYANSGLGVTISNSDTVPGISLVNAAITEGNVGTVPMIFTASLSAPINQIVTATYTTSAGTATANTDYTQTTGVVSFAPNATTTTFTVAVIGDTTAEGNETFNVTLSNPVGATIIVGQAVGTIVDDDGGPVPAKPILSVSAGFASAFLSWQSVPGTTSYSIYRGTTFNGEGSVPLASGIVGTKYTDTGLANGTTYYYRLTAVSTQAGISYESTASDETAVMPTPYAFSYFFTSQSYAFAGIPTNQSNLLSLNGYNIENIGFYGSNMQLTDGGTNQTDSVFTLNPVSVTRFATQFTFQQTRSFNDPNPIGGGLTFTIQGVGSTALGAADAGLGYGGISNSVAVKFDLFNNAGEGPNSTGLYTNGATPTAANSVDLTGSGIDLHSGHLFNVGMTYDSTVLKVTITDTVTLAQATQSYVVNIPAIVGNNSAFVGFTAGTGALTAVQDITSWYFTPAPVAPSNLLATTGTGSQVNLHWTNNDLNSAAVLIERKTGAAGTYAPIGSTNSSSANTYSDNTAVAGTTYYYRVQATNSGSTSLYSNEANVTTANPQTDLQITNTDGQTTAAPGSPVTYTLVITNTGPSSVTGVTITDVLPATLTNVSYTATATGGASGFWANVTGINLANTVDMPAGSTITYLVHANVSATATGSVSNTATVAVPAGVTDTNASNNSATDTDTISGTQSTGQVKSTATVSPPKLNYPNGFAATATQFSFNGSSAKIVGQSLQLTGGIANQAASAFSRTAVDVTHFSSQFSIQLLNGTNPSADGMTFTIQGTGLTALGGSAENLGYGGIKKSVAVKFDLNDNAGEGSNSTGLYINGASPTKTNSVNLTGSGIDLHSGHVFNVSLTYNGTTLSVTIADATTRAQATQSYNVNIPTTVGGNTAFVGFTGGTSARTATQNVLNWTYAETPAPTAVAAVQNTTTTNTAKADNNLLLTTTTTATSKTTQSTDRSSETVKAAPTPMLKPRSGS